MKLRLIVRAGAEAELAEAAEWYEQRRPGLGGDFIEAVQQAIDAIASAPGSYPLWKTGYPYRKHVLRRFPFVLFFTIEAL